MSLDTVAHWHLLLNHIPILGPIFVTILFVIALFYRNVFLQKVALWFLVAIALFTAATYLTGDKAAQAVQSLPGISQEMIHSHELFAKYGLGSMFVTGAIALGGALFYSRRSSIPRPFLTAILVILLFNCCLFTYIGFLGGQIHHPEIRNAPLIQRR